VEVLIFGTGAMASLVGAHLARTRRARVTLAGTWTAAIEAVRANGLRVEEETGSWSATAGAIPIGAVAPAAADLVVVLVKSQRTGDVAATAALAARADGCVLTLQNGLGNREVLERACGRGRVGVGAITAGAMLLAPGRVRMADRGRVILAEGGIGPDAAESLAGLFADAGFAAETAADLEPVVWMKLAVNCAINPLSALLGVTNGALLDSAPARQRLAEAAREVGAVAEAGGILLGQDPARLALEVAARTARNRSSMLQDLDRGAPTEIEFLCGAVAREGRRLGVPTPVNDRLWSEVRRRETERRPDAQAPTGVG
jgi:2-dehydropantoate 2-reductase